MQQAAVEAHIRGLDRVLARLVAEGQVLGTVSSIDGAEVLQTVVAPAAGVPMFVTSSLAVAADGLLLGLGAA